MTIKVQSGVAAGRSEGIVRLAAAAVVIVGLLLTATAVVTGPNDPADLPLAAAVSVLAFAALLRPVEPAPGEKFSLAAAAMFFGAQILSPGFAVGAAAIAVLGAKLVQRRSPINTTVNLAQVSAATAAASLVRVAGPNGIGGLTIGAIAYALTTLALVSTMIAVAQSPTAVSGFLKREWLPTAALVAAGGMAGIVWAAEPVALLLVFPPLAVIEIAARRAAQERRAITDAERATRSQQEFVADAAHELRSRLMALRGNLVFVTPENLDRDEAQALTDARADAASLDALVEGLLTLARTDAARRDEFSDLSRIVGDVIRALPRRSGLSLELSVAGRPRIAVPAELVEIVVRDLAQNAVAYTPEGSVRISVETEADRVKLTIADTGIGIPAGELPKIFDRFFRGERARSIAPGAGLGLAIVRRVITAYDGSLEIHSTAGEGTTVTVQFPLAGAFPVD